MTALTNILQADWAELVGWTLLHSLWQIALVAAAYAVLARVLRSRSADARYLIGCAALVAMLILPLGTYVVLSYDSAAEPIDAVASPVPPGRRDLQPWALRLGRPCRWPRRCPSS